MNELERLGEQIEKLFGANSARREEIGELGKELTELKTVVRGVDGNNGLSGRMRDLEDAMKDHLKDCPVGNRLDTHFDEHKTERSNSFSARQFWVGQALVIILFVIGLFVRG